MKFEHTLCYNSCPRDTVWARVTFALMLEHAAALDSVLKSALRYMQHVHDCWKANKCAFCFYAQILDLHSFDLPQRMSVFSVNDYKLHSWSQVLCQQ